MPRTPKTIAELSTISPFDRVSERDLRPLSPHVDRLRLPAGAVIAREGEQAREFVAVLSGEVSLLRSGDPFASIGPGSQIGGDAVLRHGSHDATSRAESEVEVLVLNGPAFRWASQVLFHDTAA